MSTLRNQLDELKSQHEATRYPGDLASEVLPPVQAPLRISPSAPSKSVTANRWFWALGSSSAVAASLIVGFLLTAGPRAVSDPAVTNSGGSGPIVTARPVNSGVNSGVNSPGYLDGNWAVEPDRNLMNPLESEFATSPVPYTIDLAGSKQNLQNKQP